MSQDPYATLGVSRDADDATIKKAYRKLARELHPDVNPDPHAQERFKEVTSAYEVLSDPEKRRVFDLGGDPFGAGGGAGFGAGFSFTDIMDAFFGGGSGGGSGRGPRPRVRRGQDALVGLDISLAEAAFGTTRELKVDTAIVCTLCSGNGSAAGSAPTTCGTCQGRGEVLTTQRSFLGEIRTMRPCAACRGYGTVIADPCRECAGDGRVRSRRTLNVKIPPGVDAGTRVQLSGQGEVGPGGGPAGDLFVELSVTPHDVFTRDGRDLHATVTVPMTAAALGASLQLPTLEADLDSIDLPNEIPAEVPREVTLEIAPGTQPGAEIVLGGMGVPSLRGGGRGDLVVTVVVEIPSKLDDTQRDLLAQLAAARGEERPTVSFNQPHKSVFDRIRDAWGQR